MDRRELLRLLSLSAIGGALGGDAPGASARPDIGNGMGMDAAHPIHLHGRQFRVVDRRGGRTTNTLRAGIVDAGWRDTVLVLPGNRFACR